MSSAVAYGHYQTSDYMPTVIESDNAIRTIEAVDDAYTYHVFTFTDWLRERDLPLTFDSVADYFRELNGSDYAAGTKRIKRQAVKNRLTMLADRGGLSVDMRYQFDTAMQRLDKDADTKSPKLNSAAISASKTITEAEYQALLLNARSARQALFTRFLWQTGCRVSELTGAKLGSCKQEGQTVVIRLLGKGKKERMVRITADLYSRIRETFAGNVYLFETAGGKPYRRSYVSEQIAKLARAVLGRRVSAHKLRHSFVTRQVTAHPEKIPAISQYVGHSSVSITLQMYHHNELTDADLFGVEAVEAWSEAQ